VLYIYAYTNHKENLDSLRRAKALYEAFKKQDIEVELLVNEYRAQLLARDWGLPLATTIETIKDIDAVATVDDIVIIDSPEELEGKVLEYGRYFKKVIYINATCNEQELEEAINIKLGSEGFIYPNIEDKKLNDKTIFIYGDSDYEKIILKNLEIFKDKNLDIYWGNYFFVKYEDTLAEVFNKIVEPEEYYEVLKEYKNIITSSVEIAIETKANGLNVAFLELVPLDECKKEILNKLEIPIGIDSISIDNIQNKLTSIINNIDNEIVKITKDYM